MFDKEAAAVLNATMLDQLGTQGGPEKIAQESLTYLRTILRESSFARRILPPQGVTRPQVQRSPETDTVEFIRDIEPDSYAMALNFRSEADAMFVQGKRYRIPFWLLSTRLYEKPENELYAYDSPLIKLIEQNSVGDLAEVEDDIFIRHVDLAVLGFGNWLDDAGLPRLTKQFLADGFSLIDNNRKPCSTILMSKPTFNDILGWQTQDLGEQQAGKVLIDGYSYDQLLGLKLVVTVKVNLIPYGYIYLFTEPEFLGDFLVLNTTKFMIDRYFEMVRWKMWEVLGMGIGDVRGVARLRYGAAVL